MSYRLQSRFRERLEPARRKLAALLSRRVRGTMDSGLTPELLGREAADGDRERDHGDSFQPVGLVARAGAAAVESIAAFIGADSDHLVELATLDHRRTAIIKLAGLDADETIVYTSQTVIKLDKDGMVHIGPVGELDQFEPVVLRSEFNAAMSELRAAMAVIKGHIHTVPGGAASPSTELTDLSGPGDAEGTAHLCTK